MTTHDETTPLNGESVTDEPTDEEIEGAAGFEFRPQTIDLLTVESKGNSLVDIVAECEASTIHLTVSTETASRLRHELSELE